MRDVRERRLSLTFVQSKGFSECSPGMNSVAPFLCLPRTHARVSRLVTKRHIHRYSFSHFQVSSNPEKVATEKVKCGEHA